MLIDAGVVPSNRLASCCHLPHLPANITLSESMIVFAQKHLVRSLPWFVHHCRNHEDRTTMNALVFLPVRLCVEGIGVGGGGAGVHVCLRVH